MEPNKMHLRHCLLLLFNQNETAAGARRILCKTYGEHTISISACEIWFKKFRSGDFNLTDKPSGRMRKLNADVVRRLVQLNSTLSLYEIAEMLDVCVSTVSRYLRELGMRQKNGKWVYDPHCLLISKEHTISATSSTKQNTVLKRHSSIKAASNKTKNSIKNTSKTSAKTTSKTSIKPTNKTSIVKQKSVIGRKLTTAECKAILRNQYL